MSVLTKAIEAQERSDRAAGLFLLTLTYRGRQSEYFREQWGAHRAEFLEFNATHEILRPLRDERYGRPRA